MTRDDIIRMAREAGWDSGLVMLVGNLEVFAALVAEREREACAMVAENGLIGLTIAKAIRARGKT